MSNKETQAKIIAEGLAKGDTKALKVVKDLMKLSKGKNNQEASELLALIESFLPELGETPSYGKGNKISTCNCPTQLKRIGGRIVTIDCKGKIIK